MDEASGPARPHQAPPGLPFPGWSSGLGHQAPSLHTRTRTHTHRHAPSPKWRIIAVKRTHPTTAGGGSPSSTPGPGLPTPQWASGHHWSMSSVPGGKRSPQSPISPHPTQKSNSKSLGQRPLAQEHGPMAKMIHGSGFRQTQEQPVTRRTRPGRGSRLPGSGQALGQAEAGAHTASMPPRGQSQALWPREPPTPPPPRVSLRRHPQQARGRPRTTQPQASCPHGLQPKPSAHRAG